MFNLKVFCINLDIRKSKREWMVKHAQDQKIDIEFYTSRLHANPKRGCLESHLNVIKIAQSRGYPNILILEDDAEFTRSYSTLKDMVIPLKWDMLYLGGNVQRDLNEIVSSWRRVVTFTTHAYIINQTLYDKVISELSSWNREIDVYYAKIIHPDHLAYMINPQMVRQRPGFSDIEKRHVDYSKFIKAVSEPNSNSHSLDKKPFTFNTDKCYIINIFRRKDRWEKVSKHFDEHSVRSERWDAVDGKEYSMSEYIKDVFAGNDFDYRRGVLGCALSHLDLWKYLSVSNVINSIVIFEDDITFANNFKDIWNNIYYPQITLENKSKSTFEPEVQCALEHSSKSTSKSTWDIIYLGGPPPTTDRYPIKHPIGTLVPGTKNLYKPPQNIQVGAYSYILTKKGANKLLSLVNEHGIKKAIDWFLIDNYHNLNVCICYPYLVYSVVTRDSDIQFDFNSI